MLRVSLMVQCVEKPSSRSQDFLHIKTEAHSLLYSLTCYLWNERPAVQASTAQSRLDTVPQSRRNCATACMQEWPEDQPKEHGSYAGGPTRIPP